MAAADPTKSPAFQFYPNDFLSDANVIVMSLQARGAYITLLCVCWQQGTLPNDPVQLARFCGAPVGLFRKLWPAIEKCFRLSGDRWTHPRLERERKKQREYRKLQSDKGKASAASRKVTTVEPRLKSGSTEPQPEVQAPVQPKGNSSSSVFCLPSSDFRQREKPVSLSADDAIAERAGRFIERYEALYQKHRKGAHYLRRPTLDFAKAQELCRVWDDARLDQLVVVFLTTDHKFAEEGSRTIGQFAALASWCDGRLAEAGIA